MNKLAPLRPVFMQIDWSGGGEEATREEQVDWRERFATRNIHSRPTLGRPVMNRLMSFRRTSRAHLSTGGRLEQALGSHADSPVRPQSSILETPF